VISHHFLSRTSILSVSRNLAIIFYIQEDISHMNQFVVMHDLSRPVLLLKMFHFSHLLLSDSEMASNRRFGARVTRAGWKIWRYFNEKWTSCSVMPWVMYIFPFYCFTSPIRSREFRTFSHTSFSCLPRALSLSLILLLYSYLPFLSANPLRDFLLFELTQNYH